MPLEPTIDTIKSKIPTLTTSTNIYLDPPSPPLIETLVPLLTP